jgi:hypothetical protein
LRQLLFFAVDDPKIAHQVIIVQGLSFVQLSVETIFAQELVEPDALLLGYHSFCRIWVLFCLLHSYACIVDHTIFESIAVVS